jgi:dihydropyrimidinase
MDIWIRGGLVITSQGSYRAEIGIQGGRIACLETTPGDTDGRMIDAQGKWVLPGIIDVHTHMELPAKGVISADDFASGTRAAAYGGVTTILDFSLHRRGDSLIDCYRQRRRAADGRVAVDYGLHAEIIDPSDKVLAEIPSLVGEGVTSIKLYLAYGRDGRMVDDGQLYAVLRHSAAAGALVMVHCENGPLTDRLTDDLIRRGKNGPTAHPRSRPNLVEEEAVRRAVTIARFARGPLYIVHLTTQGALTVLREAQARNDRVWAETCPQYLLLDERVYEEENGIQYIVTPPLRSPEDQRALWEGLAQGHLSVLSTDHCPLTREQKLAARDRFDRVPSGLPGVETSLPLMYSRGVDEGRLNPHQLVAAMSTNPAKIFGLYPQKGCLQEGSDADLVIFDPEKEFNISASSLHMHTDFSPYEGLSGRGAVDMTLLRGNIIVRKGRYCGSPGDGVFLRRKRFSGQPCLTGGPS